MHCPAWKGGRSENEQLHGSRHVLEEEFQESGDWVYRCLGWEVEEEGVKDDSVFPTE